MLTVVALALLGLIAGSFLNVLILRHGIRGVGGRSVCMSCARQLRWLDMIPVLSWIALSGRCSACKARISIQYPLVEAATAILFGLIGASLLPFPAKILACLIAALLLMIAVYDLRHTIIPDSWVWTFDLLTFLSIFFLPPYALHDTLYLFLAGPIAASPLFLLWLVSRGKWMGFGDVKLALGIGWLLGPLYGTLAVFFAFIIGAVISVGILLPLPHIIRALARLGITSYTSSSAGFTMRSEIPFGPFLVCSVFILWFLILYGVEPLSVLGGLP